MKQATIKIGVVIGRMNPPHNGHRHLIQQALNNSARVIVCFGSAHSPRTPKNPFTVKERSEMVDCMFSPHDQAQIEYTSARDYHYSDAEWVMEVRRNVINLAHKLADGDKFEITLFGFEKDKSSSYLKWFPEWKYQTIEPYVIDGEVINATEIREYIFDQSMESFWRFGIETFEPETVKIRNRIDKVANKYVIDYINKLFFANENLLLDLREWHQYILQYKQAWASAPFPPVFVTGDAVVFCNGYVLTVTRGTSPGRGLLALPGGFMEQEETVEQCILRELKEETRIDVPPGKLKNSLKEIRVFDAPQRSSRGRTITHAGLIVLDEPALPKVKGSDDASHAAWLPLEQLPRLEERFFEDHYHIIHALISINK